jgi:hypothetical protein
MYEWHIICKKYDVQRRVQNLLFMYGRFSQMKLARTFLFLFAILAVSAVVYSEDPYRMGFLDGIKQGLVDKASGSNFNYEANLSNQSETSAEYRAGYRDGYTEGYKKAEPTQETAEFNSAAEAFKYGYDQGYNHGQVDSQTGRGFDYRRNPHFESGMTFETYRDENYRAGYKQGYEEAYTDHPRNSDIKVQVIPSKQKSTDSVRIFTDAAYGGQSEQLSVGRYPYLEDWNDQIQSVQINGNVRVILYDQKDFQGKSIVLEENSPNLEAFNFNKRAASMMIVRISE